MRDHGAPFDEEKYIDRPDTTLSPTHRDKLFLQTMKRQPDTASGAHPPPVKRSRSMQKDTQAGIGPPRRSARLRARQLSVDQAAAGAGTASKRTALSQANLRQFGVNKEQTSRAVKNKQKPKLLERPHSPPQVKCEDQFYPTTSSRKRQNSTSESEHEPKRTRLTREALALFNKMGEEEGEASAPTTLESTTESSTFWTTSTMMSGFAMQAFRNGILHPLDSKPPVNLDDIRGRHAQSRGTASPTESMYKDFVWRVGTAPNEATMAIEVCHQLLKDYPDDGYHPVLKHAFTGFPKDAGFNNGLPVPKPGFVQGLELEQFRPCPIHLIDGAVLYEDDPNSVTLPHLAGEFNGPGNNMINARLQSAYYGASLVYGRNQALNSIRKPSIAGHAKVTTFTTDGTTLNLFAHYATPSEDGTTEYHQYPINSTILTNSLQDFRQGYRQIRNAQDYAREESYKLRDHLKENWKARKSQPVPLPLIEDEDDCQVIDREPVYRDTSPTPSRLRYSKASRSSKGE